MEHIFSFQGLKMVKQKSRDQNRNDPKIQGQKVHLCSLFIYFYPSYTKFPMPDYSFFTLSPQMFFFPSPKSPQIFFPLTSFIFYTKVSFLTQKGLEVARCLPTEGLYMFHMLILLLQFILLFFLLIFPSRFSNIATLEGAAQSAEDQAS